MQYRQLIYSALAATILFSSCEKTINVNTPPVTHKLVLNYNERSGEPLMLQVSHNASIKERNQFVDLTVPNAVVRLYTDGNYTETLVSDSAGQYYSFALMQAGHQYMLKASAPSYPDINATATVPVDVPINTLTRAVHARKDQDGNMQDLLTLTFTDPAAPGDFYIIKVNSPNDTQRYYFTGFCVNSPDAGIETYASDLVDATTCLDNNGIFLRDELFNGKVKELKLYAPSEMMAAQFNGTDSLYSTVELFHVTEDYFKYRKSYKIAELSNGDPFSEPVNVYTNIVNGYGIFSIYSADKREVR